MCPDRQGLLPYKLLQLADQECCSADASAPVLVAAEGLLCGVVLKVVTLSDPA
jgi:hypothetical protein